MNAIRVVVVALLLVLSVNLGALVARHDWPSLHDRTMWTPAEVRRETNSMVYARQPADVDGPRRMSGYAHSAVIWGTNQVMWLGHSGVYHGYPRRTGRDDE